MSSNVEERVVEMRFDNKQFEKNADQTIKTLDKLDKSLDLKGSTEGFKNLEKAAKNVDLSAAANAVEAINSKFSRLGTIGDQVLRDLTHHAEAFAIKLAKSMTTDQINKGWEKYESKTKAVQVIMHATNADIQTVDKSLAKLTKYTDETSYSFSNMVDAISKFTGANIQLEDAESAVEGIANWAATAGVGPEKAASAFYNLSQAMSSGALRAQDWRSIELLNMNTVEFEETAIRVAEEMIADGRASEQMAAAFKKTSPKVEGFRDTLSSGWLDKNVMVEVFKQYSDVTTEFGLKAFKAAQEAKTFTEALEAAKDAAATGWSTIFEQLFGNYEEAKVFWTEVAEEMIDAVTAPISALSELLKEWHNDGGYIAFINSIRNAWAAVKGVAEEVKVVFDKMFPPITSDKLVSITKNFEKLTNKWKQFTSKIDISELEIPADELIKLQEAGEDLTWYWKNIDKAQRHNAKVEQNLKGFKDAVKSVFSIINSGKTVILSIFKVISPFKKILAPLGKVIVALGNTIASALDKLVNSEAFKNVVGFLENISDKIATAIADILNSFLNLGKGKGAWSKFISWLSSAFEKIKSLFNSFSLGLDKDKFKISDWFGEVLGKIKSRFNKFVEDFANSSNKFAQWLSRTFESIKGVFRSPDKWQKIFDFIHNAIKSAYDKIAPILSALKEWFTEAFGNIDIKTIGHVITAISALGTSFLGFNKIRSVFKNYKYFRGLLTDIPGNLLSILDETTKAGKSFPKALLDFFNNLAGIPNKISMVFDKVGSAVDDFAKKRKVGSLRTIAVSLLMLAAALVILASIDGPKLAQSLIAAGAGLGALVGAFKLLGMTGKDGKSLLPDKTALNNFRKLAVVLILIAIAIKILSGAVKKMGEMDGLALARGLLGVFAIMAMLVSLSYALPDPKDMTINPKFGIGVIALAVGMLILARAVKKLGEMDPDGLKNGLLSIIALLGVVGYMAIQLSNQNGINVKAGIGMIAFATGILILASAVKKLGEMDLDAMEHGLLAVIGLLGMVGYMAVQLSQQNGINVRFGIGVIALAAGILILVKAVSQLADLDSAGSLTSGLFAIGSIMAMIAALANSLQGVKGMGKMAASIIIMGVAMNIFAKALATMGENKNLFDSVSAIAYLFVIIAAFSAIMSKVQGSTIGLAAALIAFSVAITIFAVAMKILGSLSWEGIVKGLVAIVGMFVVLGASAALLAPVIPLMLALSVSLLIVGVATLAVAAGLLLLTTAFTALAATSVVGATAFVAALGIVANGLLTTASVFAQGAALFITSLIVTLAEYADIIIQAIVELIIKLIKTLAESAPEYVKSLAELIINLFSALANYAPQILDALFRVLEALVTGLSSALDKYAPAIFEGWTNIVTTLIDGIFSISVAAFTTVADKAGEVFGAIGGVIGETLGEVIGGILEGISNHFDELAVNLDSFLEALSPFLEKLNVLEIDESKINALKAVAEAILALTAAELLDRLANIGRWLKGKKNFSEFADQVAAMGPAMATYGDAVKDVDSAAITASAGAVKAMAEVATNLGRSGGLISKALGKPQTLDTFAKQLSDAAPNLAAFAEVAPSIAAKSTEIEGVAETIKQLVAAASALNVTDVTLDVGDGWLTYAKHVEGLGEFMQAFVDVNDVTTARFGIKEDGTFGVIEELTNKKGIGTILQEFSNSLEGVDLDKLSQSSDVLETLARVGNVLQNKETEFSYLFGAVTWKSETQSGITQLLQGLVDNMDNLRTVSTKLDYTTIGKLENLAGVFSKLADAEKTLTEMGSFGYAISTLTTNLKNSAQDLYDTAGLYAAADSIGLSGLMVWVQANIDAIKDLGDNAVTDMVKAMTEESLLKSTEVANGLISDVCDKTETSANQIKAKEAGRFFVQGFANGIAENINLVTDPATRLSETTIQTMRRVLRIYSPSRVMRKLGDYTGEGFVLGLEDWVSASATAGDDLARSVTESAAGVLEYIGDLMNGDLVVDMTIRPVLDLSNMQPGLAAIDTMFSQRQALAAQIDAGDLMHRDEVAELVDVSWKILKEIQNGRDVYLDGKVLATSMNRRLGRMEGMGV